MNNVRQTRRWVIAARPIGRELQDTDFTLETTPVPALREGDVLVRTTHLSFDPALKGWMENVASYANPTEIGGLMPGDGAASWWSRGRRTCRKAQRSAAPSAGPNIVRSMLRSCGACPRACRPRRRSAPSA